MYERMLDPLQKPTREALTAYCGAAGPLLDALEQNLTAEGAGTEIRFPYGKSYGWSLTLRRKRALWCDVFAEAGALNVMMRLTDAQFASVYGALLPSTQAAIDRRYPCGDGGWLHLRVQDESQLRDALTLLMRKVSKA